MKKIKEIYSQPTCDLLVIRFEQNLLNVSNGVNWASTPNRAGGDDVYDANDGEDF